MNTEDTEIPFNDILSILFSEDDIHISQLYRLSDMAPDEFALFKNSWPSQTAERRYEIIRHLADISEDSFLVEFSPVFSICLSDEDPRIRQSSNQAIPILVYVYTPKCFPSPKNRVLMGHSRPVRAVRQSRQSLGRILATTDTT